MRKQALQVWGREGCVGRGNSQCETSRQELGYEAEGTWTPRSGSTFLKLLEIISFQLFSKGIRTVITVSISWMREQEN